MAKIAILGCGFGTALAVMCDKYGHEVTLWSAFENEISEISKTRENKKLLPGIKLNKSIKLSNDLSCIKGRDIIIFAIPSVAIRDVAKKVAKHYDKKAIVVSVAKGFEEGSLKLLSEVLEEELKTKIVVLSGPSHAEEIARNMPTVIVSTSKDEKLAKHIRDVMSNEFLRIYSNDDILGVQLGGALKNIIALASGILAGLGYGDNTKAALMTRGLSEIARLGVAFGAKKETFAGLSGVGDLIVTCTSMHSRNYQAGLYIGQGFSVSDALEKVGKTVEGIVTAKNAHELMKKTKTYMPIVEEMYKILFKNKAAKLAMRDLLKRPKKDETESNWLDS